jgi:hypothetical protein
LEELLSALRLVQVLIIPEKEMAKAGLDPSKPSTEVVRILGSDLNAQEVAPPCVQSKPNATSRVTG